jgi:cysteinyl-tRNA synthetase
MVSLIEELIEKGHAYAPGNGDVYYRVESYPPYGQLSKQRPDEMRETEKGTTGYKESPLDFALWKASKPGEPSWESPWGPGRPGWHIECSAMVEKHLPNGADIHGGGADLRFPHHENELAQSDAAHPDRTFVRAWAHHGLINIASGKMAKSLGNILDVERAVELHGPNALRMWFLQGHYSQPIEYSEEILVEKKRSYEHLMHLYRQLSGSNVSSEFSDNLATGMRERFDAAMSDDFNTTEAIGAVFEAKMAQRMVSAHPETAEQFASVAEAMREALTILGFDLEKEAEDEIVGIRLRYPIGTEPEESLNTLIERRDKARRNRDWETADQLREEIRARGWEIEDNPNYVRIYLAER